MINNCDVCNKYPNTDNLISCQTETCPEFGQEHMVHDWQIDQGRDIAELTKLVDDS